MDTDFAGCGGLIVNPSDVKVEPQSPVPSPAPAPAPAPAPGLDTIAAKLEPGLATSIKQEARPLQQTSVLKPPTIVIRGQHGAASGPAARLLVPKLPSTTVKLEAGEAATGHRWRLGGAGTKILVSKAAARRAIDSHLISSHTVSIYLSTYLLHQDIYFYFLLSIFTSSGQFCSDNFYVI